MPVHLATVHDGRDVVVRPMLPPDVDDVTRFLRDPRCAPFQYPFSESRCESLRDAIGYREHNPNLEMLYRYYTITLNDRPVGHIVLEAMTKLTAGWNLDPDYWGNGIMPAALTLMFTCLFEKHPEGIIISNCFPNNRRCIRMMKKLGYEPVRLSLFEKTELMIEAMTWKKHVRFRLNKPSFDDRQNASL